MLQISSQLLVLHRHFAAVVPLYFAQHAQVVGLKLGVLTVVCTNATVAAKLRQLAPEIADSLQRRGCEVSGIYVKVQVAYTRARAVVHPKTLTPSAQRALLQLSTTLPDSALKSAVEHMLQPNPIRKPSAQ